MGERMPEATRVLFVCTGNSARSQMAEALARTLGNGRLEAGSAGTAPAAEVHPLALGELARRGIEAAGTRPKSVDEILQEHWDIVITVCDAAQESCPVFPGQPVVAHWGVADPAAATGSEDERRHAFRGAAEVLARRIGLLLALPIETMDASALQAELRRIGDLM